MKIFNLTPHTEHKPSHLSFHEIKSYSLSEPPLSPRDGGYCAPTTCDLVSAELLTPSRFGGRVGGAQGCCEPHRPSPVHRGGGRHFKDNQSTAQTYRRREQPQGSLPQPYQRQEVLVVTYSNENEAVSSFCISTCVLMKYLNRAIWHTKHFI